MGSQSNKKTAYAYIAGFLDGDGSLMLQIKKRSDTVYGLRTMVTICFYQDTRRKKPLLWIRKIFGVGYISNRKDGMTELRINGFMQVRQILEVLQPYILFKQMQAQILIKACRLLENNTLGKLTKKQKESLIDYICSIQQENYRSSKRRTKTDLKKLLGLTP